MSRDTTRGLLAQIIASAGPSRAAVAKQIDQTTQNLNGLIDREEKGDITLAGLARVAGALGYELHYELRPNANGHSPTLKRAFGAGEYELEQRSPRHIQMRRMSMDEEVRQQPDLQRAGLALVSRTLRAHHGDKSVKLSPREMLVMRRLLTAGAMIPIPDLKAAGWGDEPVSASSMRVMIHKLKSKLGSVGYPRSIVSQINEYGLGPADPTGEQLED